MSSRLLAEVSPALHWPIAFCLFSSATIFALSIITSNVGGIDRVWTILPTIYVAYFALLPLWHNDAEVPRLWGVPLLPYRLQEVVVEDRFSPRPLLMLVLVLIWMVRLGYNTWRRGLFNPAGEDYRWAALRQSMHPFLFQVFNVIFISFIQNVLLLSLSFPTYLAAILPHGPLTTTDYVLFVTGLLLLGVEFTADNQQWAFQNYKRLFLAHEKSANADGKAAGTFTPTLPSSAHWPFAAIPFTPRDAHRGFITKGLWAWSRHPNFLCEQSFRVLVTLFPVLSDPLPTIAILQEDPLSVLLPFVPALCQIILFIGSTIFTESISRSRYPDAYPVYQKRVGVFFPGPWGLVISDEERKRGDKVLWGEGKEE